jgi:hypothetical protein
MLFPVSLESAQAFIGLFIGNFPFINTFLTGWQNRTAYFFGQENMAARRPASKG